MKILLTNDDGYDSDGLKALVDSIGRKHDICVLAPDSERSGMSHSMSLRQPLKVKKLDDIHYTCSGTPADCVILAVHGVTSFKPDVVISGINRGPNLGTDLVYSGTAAAARQATLIGIPGIAVSLATYNNPFRYKALARLIADKLDFFLSYWSPEVFVNINAPDAPEDHEYEIGEGHPSKRVYKDTLKFFDGPDNYSYCFFMDGQVETHKDEGSDEDLVSKGMAAITKVMAHPCFLAPGKNGGS